MQPSLPQTLTILRRDFTHQRCCEFCSRELTSGTGYIMADPVKGEVAVGPNCAEARGIRSPSYVDFVASMLAADPAKARYPVTPNSHTARAALQVSDEELVRRYLILRYEKLGQKWLGYVRNSLLEPIYDRLVAGEISSSDYAQAREVMRHPDIAGTNRSPGHLLRVYQARCQIESCLERDDHNAERLREAADFLRKHLSLTSKMVSDINAETARRSPHLPRMRIDAFDASENVRIAEMLARPGFGRVPMPA